MPRMARICLGSAERRLAISTIKSSRSTRRTGQLRRSASPSRQSQSSRTIAWLRPRQVGAARHLPPAFAAAGWPLPPRNPPSPPRTSAGVRVLQAGVQLVPQRVQVADVFQRIVDLPIRQRASTPVGAGLALARSFAQQLENQVAISGRIIEADHAGGDLHVEHSSRRLLHGGQAEVQLLAPGVDDRLVAGRRQHLPEFAS